jgi:hypothetical protein
MFPTRIRLALASLLTCVAAAAAIAAPIPDGPPASRTCGTAEPSRVERQQTRNALDRFRAEATSRVSGGTIRVAFHVITSNGRGNVSDAQIEAQIEELNRGFKGTGYKFELASVDRTDNGSWFKMSPGAGSESRAKQALAVDPAHHLNIYTCSPAQQLLGWAYFPSSVPEDSFWHGIVVHYESLPGGGFTNFNLGRTAVHEAGHYLGLFHTFQGGCVAPGDEVEDTPFEASPASGCPIGRDTCEQPGFDPVQNYMDYSDDACYTEFTAGQDARMDEMVSVYKPSLFASPAASRATQNEIEPSIFEPGEPTRALAFRGAWPNPFRRETAVHFTLPVSGHVSLKVYDIAGKLMTTLVDAPLPPGEHSAMFRSDELPSGMYFTVLRVGGVHASRSVVLMR